MSLVEMMGYPLEVADPADVVGGVVLSLFIFLTLTGGGSSTWLRSIGSTFISDTSVLESDEGLFAVDDHITSEGGRPMADALKASWKLGSLFGTAPLFVLPSVSAPSSGAAWTFPIRACLSSSLS